MIMKGKLKKILAVCLSAALIFAFTACGSSDIDSDLSMAPAVEKYLESVDQEYAYGIAETLAYDEEYLSNELG